MPKGKRSKEFNEGYDAAIADLSEEENKKLFMEGYKAGFRDGAMAFAKEVKNRVPSDLKQTDDETQPWIWMW
ncbi:MAG: hypothetical protein LUQ24_06225 [Methanobacterium sp.]|nr:hypothetical protein [Methanobacterium sp.]